VIVVDLEKAAGFRNLPVYGSVAGDYLRSTGVGQELGRSSGALVGAEMEGGSKLDEEGLLEIVRQAVTI
jgi:hypothetical protein